MTYTGGSGGPLTDRTSVSYGNGVKTSTAHIYAAGLDWTKSVGVLVYGDGSGEQGLVSPSSTYLMAGTNGLVAVAKRHNMVLVTPRAPGNGCTDGDGVCWYLGSNDGTTRAQKTKWLDDLIKNEVLAKYDIDKTRVCLAGFSSGAENVAGIYGPAYAASWMEDGLLLAISYGSSPAQYGVTSTYTADFRANVAAVWDVRGGDETTAVADSLEGHNWYVAAGFATTERNVIPGGAHDRPGEFGSIVDAYVTEHVSAATTRGGGTPPPQSAGRTNLCPNPALTTVSTGWSGVSGGRITNGSGSLPRQTAYAALSSASGDVLTPLFDCTPGLPYVGSVWIRSFASGTAKVSLAWYNSAGSLISSNPVAVTLSTSTGTRYEVGPIVAPSGAVQGRLRINDLESWTGQVTGVLVEQTGATGGSYFDGNSTGASWTGTAGNSPSVIQDGAVKTESWSWAEAAAVATSTPGPTGGESWSWTDSAGTVIGEPAEPIGETWSWRDSGAIISSGYDPQYGRIRVHAAGLPASAIRVVVESRPTTSKRWTQVRGGKVAVLGGSMVRRVDDYEFVAGVGMVYRITALASPDGSPDVVVAQITVEREADPTGTWLKFITAPQLNRRVILSDFGEVTRRGRTALYDVEGRAAPVAVSDVMSGRSVTITVETMSLADRDSLDAALARGLPLFVHTPVSNPLPSMYAVVDGLTWARPRGAKTTAAANRARFELPLIEVDAPPPSVVSPTSTWAMVLEQFGSWAEVLDAHDTWADLL